MDEVLRVCRKRGCFDGVTLGAGLSIRLVVDAFNVEACALYMKAGFDMRDQVVVVELDSSRTVAEQQPQRPRQIVVREMQASDYDSCKALSLSASGIDRTQELDPRRIQPGW